MRGTLTKVNLDEDFRGFNREVLKILRERYSKGNTSSFSLSSFYSLLNDRNVFEKYRIEKEGESAYEAINNTFGYISARRIIIAEIEQNGTESKKVFLKYGTATGGAIVLKFVEGAGWEETFRSCQKS